MKNLLLMIFIIIGITATYAEVDPSLMHRVTDTEKDMMLDRDFYETDPPIGPVRQTAEFEKMEGVLIRYPFGISYDVIRELAEDVTLYTIVSNQSQENTVLSQYNSHDVNVDNCMFIHAPSDSYWTRDYGPIFMVDGNNEVGIVNFRYNRPRPNDNDIPIEVADFLDVDLYGMNVVHTGGNYMTDGMGIGASTTIVYTESQQEGITNAQVDQRMLDYLGIHTYHVIDDPNNTYIDHIDCWGKFLDVDKVLLREVPESHAQYDEIEEVVDYFEAQTSSYGTPYEIYRVYTPQNQPYTNSLILNNKVLVPITGSSYDDDAIQSYQDAMPGYEIIGLTGSWESTDALHCRTRGIADRGMLYVKHIPILGLAPADTDYELDITLIPYSGSEIVEGSAKIYYKANNDEYSFVEIVHESGFEYSATIPEQEVGSVISYYIQVEDETGRVSNHPFIGSPDPHEFTVGVIIPPQLSVNPDSFNIELGFDDTLSEILSLSNIGGGEISYSIQIENVSSQNRSIEGSYMECISEEFSPGETIDWEFTIYCTSDDDEWISEVEIQFPAGVYVNSSTDLIGGTDDIVSQGQTGDGATVSWIDLEGYGSIHPGEAATTTVNVTISSNFSSDIELPWIITGDEWGSEPHTVNGEITILNAGEPISWIELMQNEGSLEINETDEISVEFNSYDLQNGIYQCNIVITDDLRNETIIPVNLEVNDTVSNGHILSNRIDLHAYPNPFNPETTITFSLTEDSAKNTELAIYNLKGQKIKTLVNEVLPKGTHSVAWNGKNDSNQIIGSGIYLYNLKNSDQTITKRVILLK